MPSYTIKWHKVGHNDVHVTKVLNSSKNIMDIHTDFIATHFDRVVEEVREIRETSTRKRKEKEK